MKKLSILCPILASAALAPVTTTVSCSKNRFEINDWWGSNEAIQSESTDVESGQTWDFVIDMTQFLGGLPVKHPEYYPYFDLKLTSGIGESSGIVKIENGSLSMYIDGVEVSSDDWQYNEEIGAYRFEKDSIRSKIFASKKITGSFTITSWSGEPEGTIVTAAWYSPYTPTSEVR